VRGEIRGKVKPFTPGMKQKRGVNGVKIGAWGEKFDGRLHRDRWTIFKKKW